MTRIKQGTILNITVTRIEYNNIYNIYKYVQMTTQKAYVQSDCSLGFL